MAFDFKKEYKEFYLPKSKPSIVVVPKMNYLAVRGKGDPNQENSEYKQSIGYLYAIAFGVKMSHMGSRKMDGYFNYVVPPLEGFWWMNDGKIPNFSNKTNFNFISVIRLPDFVTKADFEWAVQEATSKKQQVFSKVEFFSYEEGLSVQSMHIGTYDTEPATIKLMDDFALANGYLTDINSERFHHEIYLSDPRKIKTVIRHPIKRIIEVD